MAKGLSPKLTYHNLAHTRDVVESTERIFDYEYPHRSEAFYLVKLAALFHDCGFLDQYEEHEARSAEIAASILQEEGVNTGHIATIQGIILATKVGVVPQTPLHKIIRDADLDYLGREDFFQVAKQLYHEWEHYGRIPEDIEWTQLQINFLENHRYCTEFGKKVREPIKQQHLKKLKQST